LHTNKHRKRGRGHNVDGKPTTAGISEYKDQFFNDDLDSDGKLAQPDHRVLDIDLNAAADTVKLAIHFMRQHGGGGGSIVITTSLAGYLASAGAPMYSAAKHGVVGLMRALKNDTAKVGIAMSVVAPGITVTPILSQGQSRGSDPEVWAKEMAGLGVPINRPESIALAVGFLMNEGMAGNGKGIFVQADRMWDLERGMAGTRELWMGKEMLDLFRGGRKAPLFAATVKEESGRAAKL